MPLMCEECPCYDCHDYSCNATGRGVIEYRYDGRPDNCPLSEHPNPPLTSEAKIRQKARKEFLDELRGMTFEEIADLIEKGL